MISLKQCSKCLENKQLDQFHKQKSTKDGFQCYCKSCKTLILKEYKIKRLSKKIDILKKECFDCYKILDIKMFNFNPLGADGHEKRCKSCQSFYSKQYRKNNIEKLKEKKKKYYLKNKEYIKKKVKNYVKENRDKVRKISLKIYHRRYNTDLHFNLITKLRSRLNSALKNKKWKKNSKFSQYIGCSLEDLKLHLEKQFQPGMSWKNRKEWHIDHIIPLSSAKNEQELYKLCHYTNLQPLWAIDNIKKGNKVA